MKTIFSCFCAVIGILVLFCQNEIAYLMQWQLEIFESFKSEMKNNWNKYLMQKVSDNFIWFRIKSFENC